MARFLLGGVEVAARLPSRLGLFELGLFELGLLEFSKNLPSFLPRGGQMFEKFAGGMDKLSKSCYKSNIATNSNGLAMELFERVAAEKYSATIS
ncbi:hypothetical protein [Corynebacterium simulans]|uniref:hypothetical protein n=1 Tax=Corynebacterium simulans TaxID=146827 RepID=UPI0011A6C5E6|nr:hypothetical protein [Corynebacterium simulans]